MTTTADTRAERSAQEGHGVTDRLGFGQGSVDFSWLGWGSAQERGERGWAGGLYSRLSAGGGRRDGRRTGWDERRACQSAPRSRRHGQVSSRSIFHIDAILRSQWLPRETGVDEGQGSSQAQDHP